MKVALLLSVVALVAVAQLPPRPFQVCDLLRSGFGFQTPMECCIPEVWGGCNAPIGQFPPGMTPPGYMPPPQFLDDVCCKQGTECCLKDDSSRFPQFDCCDNGEHCTVTDGMGVCDSNSTDVGTTPMLLPGGQCPDGSLPILRAPGMVARCSLNPLVQEQFRATCADGDTCVQDLSGNVNEGVCCQQTSTCSNFDTCQTCVMNEDRPCGWLALGEISNAAARCVPDCHNFPGKSCILPGGERFCYAPENSRNGTLVNTGSCFRRCSSVGTGREDRITNSGTGPSVDLEVTYEVTDCCTLYPGDFCCNAYGERAAHCANGRVPGLAECGVPLRRSPMFSPYGAAAPFTPYGFGAGFGGINPYFGGGFGGFGPQPFPFVPSPYGMYGREEMTDVEEEKQQMFFPPAPQFFPPAPRGPTPPIVSQPAGPFVCSCDDKCLDFDDCCFDYEDVCVTE